MTTLQEAWDAEAALRGEQEQSSSTTTPEAGTETIQGAASETTEKQQEVQPAAKAEEVVPDPLEEIRKNYLALQQSQSELLQRLARTEQVTQAAVGRVAAWQSEQDAARKAAADKAAKGSPSSAEIAAAATPETWNTLKSEFPEWGEAIEALVDSKTPAQTGPAGVTLEQVEERLSKMPLGAQIDAETRKDLVESIIPGWQEKINTPAFGTWYATQPENVRALGASEKVSDAVKLIRSFEAHAAKQAAEVNVDDKQAILLDAAGARPGASRADAGTSQLTPEQIWEQEAEATAKKRKARGY